MKINLLRSGFVLVSSIIILCLTTCSKDDAEKSTIRTGNWYGEDISFVVGDNPMKVFFLDFSYSGHATGTICSYDYESGASFVAVANIHNNAFEAELSTFTIYGTFLNDTVAEVQIDWLEQDASCDAVKSGSRIYTAGYNLIGKVAEK